MPNSKNAASALIVASVRLPVTLSRQRDRWQATPSAGGLVTALKAVAEGRPFTWIGWPGAAVPESERAAATEELQRAGTVPVYLSKAQTEGFYEGFSNGALWPLFHNQVQRARFDRESWLLYKDVNEMFAEKIAETAEPGAVIWVHDYQLLLLPALLRKRGFHGPIGFFLHIPFPSAETYRALPVREALLRGMLGADLIGFHTYEYVSHFRQACLRVLGIESEAEALRLQTRVTSLGVLPIGIDPAEIRLLLAGAEARQEAANLERAYHGKKIIVGVDRLDYTKGIPEKLLAFEELLRTHPKWRKQAVLIQVAAPTRTGVDEYKQLKRDVDELVGRINGRYGSASATPVVYVNQHVARERLAGLYFAADIALVTPVRDGMNLVALEYLAARGDRGGTLILSEFTGAAHCLPGARLVNPYNTSAVAAALADALEQGDVGHEAFGHMRAFVEENTSMRWAERFLGRLEQAASGQVSYAAQRLDIGAPPLSETIRHAQRPLLLLDYDGTLREFVVDPEAAEPNDRILNVLESLSRVSTLYIVSGRTAHVLEDWLGQLRIGLVAEHGLSIKPPGGEWQVRLRVDVDEIMSLVHPLLEDFCRRTPGSSIEYKKAAVVWHFRGADPEYGAFQAKELHTLLEDAIRRGPYKVLRGSRILEVRHEAVTKAAALAVLLERHSNADLLFFAGDDYTDEQLLAAIPDDWRERTISVWVGSKSPHANHFCDSNLDLIRELEVIAELRGAGTRGADRRRPRATRSAG